MIDILKLAEKELPYLLTKPEIWRTLDIDYFPPRVERLWCEYGGKYRLCIHTMHPTDKMCLFHKHRFPAAFKIIEGKYEMGFTHVEKEITTEEAYDLPFGKFILNIGSYYEMSHTNLAHYVKPLGGLSTSLMLSGPLFPEAEFRKEIVDRPLLPLSDERKFVLLQHARKII